MNILVTGGTGYIGSHTVIELIEAGHFVTIIDNLVNSSRIVIDRIEAITGTRPTFHKADLLDAPQLEAIFREGAFEAVIHFAGLKAVGESTKLPLNYYEVNLTSTINLLRCIEAFSVPKFIFSSSATVYGTQPIPYKESQQAGNNISSPYGKTKYFIEEIIKDFAATQPEKEITILRYFNPIGAHISGTIGEDPKGTPNNLMPYITKVATGELETLPVFGDDYSTPDGTAVRDYIHVTDVALGHLAALEYITPGVSVYNLGSGKGTSVFELISAFETANNLTINKEVKPRRDGDLPEFYADATLAKEKLHWSTNKTIEDMCRDSWRWQSQNPQGY